MKNNAEAIFNQVKQREELSTPDELRKFLNTTDFEDTQLTVSPTIDDVVSMTFNYDDIMHYLKIETQGHAPTEQDAARLRRVAILCRMFLDLEY
jgi:arginine repressor